MVKMNTIDKVFIILMGIIFSCTADENLDWMVENKIVNYGEEVFLSCQVENCCQKSAGWVKWTQDNEFTTIFIDVKIVKKEENSKYYGEINKKGFILVIRNITRDDLNIDYSCTYGFQVSKKKKLLETDVFTESAPEKENPTSSDSDINVVKAVLIVAFAIVIVGIAIRFIPLGITFYRTVKHEKASLPPNDGLLSSTEKGETSPGSQGSPDFQKGSPCVSRWFSKQSSSNTD